MKALVNTAPGAIRLQELPLPQPGNGQVRIRTSCCAVCATDLEMIAGWERTGFPSVPGHEWSGVVDAVGPNVDTSLEGTPCVAENVLADGGEVGFEHPGAYGQYFLTEAANVRVLPSGFDMAAAAMIEPLAVCVRGMSRLAMADSRSALVVGDGPIGLLTVALLKAAAVGRICCVGGRPTRLALAANLGAASVVNYHDTDTQRSADFANVIEASGSADGMTTALACAGSQARVLVIGDYGNRQDPVRWNTVLHKELTLVGSNAASGAWDEAVQLAVTGAVPLAQLVSKRYPPEQAVAAIAATRESRDVVKNLIDWREMA